jgi:hypothetical protein
MKKIMVIIGAIVLVGLIAAGSFWGGRTYQASRVEQVRARFERERGPQGGGQIPEPGAAGIAEAPGNMQGMFGGRGASGQVKTVEGELLTLSTAQDVTTVRLSADTQIVMTVDGTVTDLQPGLRVMVIGERAENGEITARQITILSEEPFEPIGPLPTGKAP